MDKPKQVGIGSNVGEGTSKTNEVTVVEVLQEKQKNVSNGEVRVEATSQGIIVVEKQNGKGSNAAGKGVEKQNLQRAQVIVHKAPIL